MNRELELLIKYGGFSNALDDAFRTFNVLRDVSTFAKKEFDLLDAIDLNVIRCQVDAILEYLQILQRYRKLSVLFLGKLSYDEAGFTIGNALFKTLDDVEKAYKNKAFL